MSGPTGGATTVPVVEEAHVPSTAGWVARGLAVAFVAWLVFAMPVNALSPFTVAPFEANAISEAVIFAIIGLSLNVLIGYAGSISIGHSAFVGIGAFTSAYVVTEMGQEFYLGVIVAAVFGGIQALVLGSVALRVSGLYFALVTLAYAEMTRNSFFNIESLTGGSAGQLAPRPTGFESDYRYYYLCLAGLAIVLFIDWRLTATKAGRAMFALRENPRVAQTWGINTKAFTVLSFVVSGFFAGIGGALLAHRDTAVVSNPFDFQLSLVFILMTVIGGLRNRAGVVVGAAFFALLRNGVLIKLLGLGAPLSAIDITQEVAPLLLAPILLLLTLTVLPGGFGRLTSTIGRWMRGGRFKFEAAEKEVQIDDVRA